VNVPSRRCRPDPLERAGGRRREVGAAVSELFFFYVLGGEDPIDYVQRMLLRASREVHPLPRLVARLADLFPGSDHVRGLQ
jgi:hypothetical protein